LCFNGLLRFLSGHDEPQYFKLTWKQTLRHKFWREMKCKKTPETGI